MHATNYIAAHPLPCWTRTCRRARRGTGAAAPRRPAPVTAAPAPVKQTVQVQHCLMCRWKGCQGTGEACCCAAPHSPYLPVNALRHTIDGDAAAGARLLRQVLWHSRAGGSVHGLQRQHLLQMPHVARPASKAAAAAVEAAANPTRQSSIECMLPHLKDGGRGLRQLPRLLLPLELIRQADKAVAATSWLHRLQRGTAVGGTGLWSVGDTSSDG